MFEFSHLTNGSYIVSDHMGFKTVVRPARIKTYWIHLPGAVEPGYSLQPVFRKTNSITHFETSSSVRS